MIPEFRREIVELNDVFPPLIRRPGMTLDRRYFRWEDDTFGSDVMSRRRNRQQNNPHPNNQHEICSSEEYEKQTRRSA